MIKETFIEQSPKTSKRSWWIKFEKNSKQILSVSTNELKTIKDNEAIVQTHNRVCKDIISGRKKLNNYTLHWDETKNNWDIDVRSNTLVVVANDGKLKPIDIDTAPHNSDIYIRIFESQKIMDIRANIESIRQNLNLGQVSYIKTEGKNLLDIYITRRNDPDYLLYVVPVDANDLLVNGRITLQLPDNINYLVGNWDKVSLYTKPVFSNYGYEVQSNVMITDDLLDKSTLYQVAKPHKQSHINIHTVNDTLEISSTITEEMLYCFEGKSKFDLHICDREVDRYIDTISINPAHIIGQTLVLDKHPHWPDTPFIIYKNKHLSVSYHGEQNDH